MTEGGKNWESERIERADSQTGKELNERKEKEKDVNDEERWGAEWNEPKRMLDYGRIQQDLNVYNVKFRNTKNR